MSTYFQVVQSLNQSFTKSTNYNWYDRHFHVLQFFQFPCKFEVLILLFTFSQFYSVFNRDSKVYNSPSCLFLLLLLMSITWSSRLAEIRWTVCISKSHRNLCVSFSRANSGLCIYHLFVWPNINFLHNSHWITLPTQSCQVLYSFRANLLNSLMWLIVSSLSPHNQHQLLRLIYSCFDMIRSFGAVLCCY